MASYTEIIADGTVLGEVLGIGVGTFFRNRRELHDKKLHRALTWEMSLYTPGKVAVIETLGDRLRTSNLSVEIEHLRKII